MGLDTSHGCWSGPYSSFNRWRVAVAKVIGIDLWHMAGFWSPDYEECKHWDSSMEWDDLPKRPLHLLLNHSDCDGELRWEDCAAIADDLESILDDLEPKGPFSDRECAARWIRGLRAAAKAKDDVTFS